MSVGKCVGVWAELREDVGEGKGNVGGVKKCRGGVEACMG